MLRGGAVLILLLACAEPVAPPSVPEEFPTPFSAQEAPAAGGSALAPLPQRLALDAGKVALGERLFRDPRLSGDGKVACSDCHALYSGGANGLPRTALPHRPPVAVNVPTVFNAAFNFRFGWSGRFEDVGEQIDFAMKAKTVMAGDWAPAAAVLARDASVRSAFAASYPDGLNAANLRDAVSLYSLSLITPNSRFDRFLRGELQLGTQEQLGYDLFRDYGCVSCHQGINVGGNMLQRLGVMRNYFEGRGSTQPADQGLFAISGREEDRHVFRVPSLRNVALTAPYFHDASAATLEQAVITMADYQLGRALSRDQAAQIAAFLRTLTGELDGRPL